MKLLKILALGFLVAATTACSKDDSNCDGNLDVEIVGEQAYRKDTVGIYRELGAPVGAITGYDSKTQEYISRSLDVANENKPVQILNANSGRVVISDGMSLRVTKTDKSIWGRTSNGVNLEYISEVRPGDLVKLKNENDQQVNGTGAKVCSSSLEAYLLEESLDSDMMAIHSIYKAKIQGQFLD